VTFAGVHLLLHNTEALDHLGTAFTEQINVLRLRIPTLAQVAFHMLLPAGLTSALINQSARLDADREELSLVKIPIQTI
jgi:hypothetical protein